MKPISKSIDERDLEQLMTFKDGRNNSLSS